LEYVHPLVTVWKAGKPMRATIEHEKIRERRGKTEKKEQE